MTCAKRASLLILCGFACLFVSTPAHSQAGVISIWGDPGFTDCGIRDINTGLVDIYIAHQFAAETKGVRFLLDMGTANLVFLGEESPFLTLGQSTTGVTVCYDACLTEPGLILTVRFFGQGLSPPCSYIQIVPHPEDPGLLELDCETNLMAPVGGVAIVNQTPECLCVVGSSIVRTDRAAITQSPDFCYWVPVEATTWGMIKSLYH